ncbi:hypothetical protein CR513_16817, partial [Mucuna pruriens]
MMKASSQIFGITLFWCAMRASNVETSFKFTVQKQMIRSVIPNCETSVRQDGTYFYDQFRSQWDKTQSWYILKLYANATLKKI